MLTLCARARYLDFLVNANLNPLTARDANNPRAIAIIPARYASLRLPGKPLREINNRPLILHTVAQAQRARTIADVIVATDDKRIFDVCAQAGVRVMMTAEHHLSGTDRIAEVVEKLGNDEEHYELIVNVQGDEPLIAPATIDAAVRKLIADTGAQVATTCERIESVEDVLSSDVVKVVIDEHSHALYFSRSPVPFPRELVRRHGSLENALRREPEALKLFRKHTGLYVYRRGFLLEYSRAPASHLEQTESLEQLRVLERNYKISVVEVEDKSIGVDTEADLAQVEALMKANNLNSIIQATKSNG